MLTYSTDVDTHLTTLRALLKSLRIGGFYINLAKAKLFRHELLCLGHLKLDTAKIMATQQARESKDNCPHSYRLQEVRRSRRG